VAAVAHNKRLPPPAHDRYAWQLAGVCRQGDPERFFLESERGHTRDMLVTQAKAVCAPCPVLESCREHGLNAQEPYGIWGGLTVQERETWLRVRRRNRPRTEPTDGLLDLASG
jgi:WhiB family redox-sensing transcriptional regulator